MATEARLSLVPEYEVAVVADATAAVRPVGERRALARTSAADHLYAMPTTGNVDDEFHRRRN